MVAMADSSRCRSAGASLASIAAMSSCERVSSSR